MRVKLQYMDLTFQVRLRSTEGKRRLLPNRTVLPDRKVSSAPVGRHHVAALALMAQGGRQPTSVGHPNNALRAVGRIPALECTLVKYFLRSFRVGRSRKTGAGDGNRTHDIQLGNQL